MADFKLSNEEVDKIIKDHLTVDQLNNIITQRIEKRVDAIITKTLTNQLVLNKVSERQISTWIRERISRIITKEYVDNIILGIDVSAEIITDNIAKKLNIEDRFKKHLERYIDKLSSIAKKII